MADIVVVGGGAAGMMAAVKAAEKIKESGMSYQGSVVLLEHNEKLGKKLFITGKGRCNITNACDTEDLFVNICRNPKFCYSAIYGFDNLGVMDFFEKEGLRLKTERGGRVFPHSDHSSDVIRVLSDALRKNGVEVILGADVKNIMLSDDESRVTGVTFSLNKHVQEIDCKSVIVATGGLSYATTGSTGDGLAWAEKLGHTITETRPSLVPFVCREEYVRGLQGLSLKNVTVSIFSGKKKLYTDFGEMLFTHFGVSGPLILSASAMVGDKLSKGELDMFIDLKSALDFDTLDKRLLRDFEENMNKNFENAISGLLPAKLIPVTITLSGIDPRKKVHDISKEERQNFVRLLKAFPCTVTGLRDYNEAIITRGGVSVKNINPSTMESKLISGLYFAGEMIDVDAKTGGFNLQIAWSTGALAGISAAEAI